MSIEYSFDFSKSPAADFNPPSDTNSLQALGVTDEIWTRAICPKMSQIWNQVETMQFLESDTDLQHLKIPDGVQVLYACGMNLERVELPDSIDQAYLSRNLISRIELPPNTMIAELDNNRLRHLSFRGKPTKIEVLNVKENPCLRAIAFEPPPWPTWVHIDYDKGCMVSEELKSAADRGLKEMRF